MRLSVSTYKAKKDKGEGGVILWALSQSDEEVK